MPLPAYRWVILGIGVFAQASFAAVFFGIPIIAPALRADFGLALGDVGVAIGSVSVGMLITVFPWGIAADRVGERLVTASGLAVASLALCGTALSREFTTLVGSLVVAGVFGASVQTASGRAVMGWFDASERGFALGIRQTAVVAGSAAAAIVLPVAVHHGGSRAALLVLAGGALAGACASLLGLRPPPNASRQ